MNISKEVRKGRLDQEKEREREREEEEEEEEEGSQRRARRCIRARTRVLGGGTERMFGGGGGLNVVLSSRTVRP